MARLVSVSILPGARTCPICLHLRTQVIGVYVLEDMEQICPDCLLSYLQRLTKARAKEDAKAGKGGRDTD